MHAPPPTPVSCSLESAASRCSYADVHDSDATSHHTEGVPLVDMPTGDGLVYMTTLAVTSGNLNFLEACYHLHTPHDAPFPGVVLSTGTEDYFDSAYVHSAIFGWSLFLYIHRKDDVA